MRSAVRLTLCHGLANAVLLGLGYYWLGVGEAQVSTLAWSFMVALALVAATAWVYGASCVFFTGGEQERKILPAYRTALGNLAPLITTVLGALILYYLLARWADYSSNPASTLASYLTLKLRKPVSPAAVLRTFNAVLWAIRWIVTPVLLVPTLANIAVLGWAGFRRFGASAARWLYWIVAPALLLCALWIPLRLLGWVPHVGSFSGEMASFAVRGLVGYLLFVGAWTGLALVTCKSGVVGARPRYQIELPPM